MERKERKKTTKRVNEERLKEVNVERTYANSFSSTHLKHSDRYAPTLPPFNIDFSLWMKKENHLVFSCVFLSFRGRRLCQTTTGARIATHGEAHHPSESPVQYVGFNTTLEFKPITLFSSSQFKPISRRGKETVKK